MTEPKDSQEKWVAVGRVIFSADYNNKRILGTANDLEMAAQIANEHNQLTALLNAAREAYEYIREQQDSGDHVVVSTTCQQCTGNNTPYSFDKGLCFYHQLELITKGAE